MTTAPSREPEASAAAGQGEQFTLQEYFTPDRKRLSRFPHLVAVSFGLVWRAARRELIEVVGLQAVSAAATAGQLFLLENVLSHLVGGHVSDFSQVVPPLAGLAALTVIVGITSAV